MKGGRHVLAFLLLVAGGWLQTRREHRHVVSTQLLPPARSTKNGLDKKPYWKAMRHLFSIHDGA